MRALLARVDLSDEARDFRAVAVEPGVPVLDTAGNSAAVLRAWLGRFVAEPVWEGRHVVFYLPEEQPGKVAVRPVTPARLHGPLRGELAELREKVEGVRPGSQFERLLHQTVADALYNLTNDPKRADAGCQLLEYRDAGGRWRLVWLPGYERVRRDKATGRLCGNPRCGLLYAQRQGYSAKCPACNPKGAARRVRRVPWKWVAAGVVAAALLVALLIWYLVQGNKDGAVAAGWPKLVVTPGQVVLWPGETGTLERVAVEAKEGEPRAETEYRLDVAEGEDVVAVGEGDTLRALALGRAELRVTAADPDGPKEGLSATVPVLVTELAEVYLDPARQTADVGGHVRFTVMAQGEEGPPRQVEAPMESLDEEILQPDPNVPGRFFAIALGGTSVRAEYRGHEAYADVTVRGERFRKVDATLNVHADDFTVTFEVLAAASQGPLEYCVYLPGQAPPESWVAAELTEDGDHREVTLLSPPIPYGPRNARYQLVIEARSPTGSVQRYPFSFRLVVSDIEAATGP